MIIYGDVVVIIGLLVSSIGKLCSKLSHTDSNPGRRHVLSKGPFSSSGSLLKIISALIIYLLGECIEKYQVEHDREHNFDLIHVLG